MESNPHKPPPKNFPSTTFDNSSLHAAVGFYGQLMTHTLCSNWDDHFEQEVECQVEANATDTAEGVLKQTRGFKSTEGHSAP
jgi:hypothetical protein